MEHIDTNSLFNETETILQTEDILRMLDSFLREQGPWWNNFYSDRNKNIPFFVNVPDENLKGYFEKGLFGAPRVLELGCGPGRNAIYFAQQGCQVDAIDISKEAIDWAIERTKTSNLQINFICDDIFTAEIIPNSYDFIYDSGCFHHIPPHRRMDYLKLIKRTLKSSGFFGLTCFASDEDGGSEISDWEVYRQKSLRGGLAYSEEKLRTIFSDFKIVELRKMNKILQPSDSFGESFLWTILFKKS